MKALTYSLFPFTYLELGEGFQLLKALDIGTMPKIYLESTRENSVPSPDAAKLQAGFKSFEKIIGKSFKKLIDCPCEHGKIFKDIEVMNYQNFCQLMWQL